MANKNKKVVFDDGYIEDMILELHTLQEIADEYKCDLSYLSRYLDADPSRSSRMRAARCKAMLAFEELSLAELRNAGDSFELAKARELVSYYKWRASKIAPASYGDKIEVQHSGGTDSNITVTFEE